mmetsp:Transcript_1735/g.2296  ORF Transcript_1735/g.2296 Transcript_1735/m.2296 type:complete len:324 (-) Transcript_1735:49-1020(-)
MMNKLKFLQRNKNKTKGNKSTKCCINAIKPDKPKSKPAKQKAKTPTSPTRYEIQLRESESVYTDILNPNDLSQSFSTTAASAANTPSPYKGQLFAKRMSSNCSLDHRIVETERKLKDQLRLLASGSFEEVDDDDENGGHSRDNNSSSFPKKQPKGKNRLMSATGVLLFDGLQEDTPDDNSLQSIIENERRIALKQYNNSTSTNSDDVAKNNATRGITTPTKQLKGWKKNSGKKKKTSREVKTPSPTKSKPIITSFIPAPKGYDPIKSGFFNPRQFHHSFYDSDDDEDVTKQTSYDSSFDVDDQECFEPSVEVVININSPLWRI